MVPRMPELEVEYRVLPHRSAPPLEDPLVRDSVPRLVVALPRQPHAEGPFDVGELGQVPGRVLQDVALLVHLAMEELHLPLRGALLVVDHLHPEFSHLETLVAGRALAEEGGIERHYFTSSGMIERKPACRSTSRISSWLNSASRRPSTFTAGAGFSGIVTPTALISPGCGMTAAFTVRR